MNINPDYLKIVQSESQIAKIDPDLFCAIIHHESSWIKNAIKYEQTYPYLVQINKFAELNHISVDMETFHQRISFGLCQLMGANFRTMGFDKPLYETLNPQINIHYGVNFFKKTCDIHKEIKDKISAYNMGSPAKHPDGTYLNQEYVNQVYAFYLLRKQGK